MARARGEESQLTTRMDPFAPTPLIDHALDAYASALDLPPGLKAAVRYALLSPGKRIRPLLAWHCCAAAGAPGERSLPAGVAIELIHAFSLVHDDLPALDNDDLRRGRPTLHKHTTEAMAILAGDAMLTLGFDALRTLAPHVLRADLAAELSTATLAMIAGQVEDTMGELEQRGSTPLARLESIHRQKTGALLRAAARMGAICGAATPDALARLTTAAEALGLMFQITDDLLDVESTAAETGKRTNKDAAAGKLTYPNVLGIDHSKREVARLLDHTRTTLAPLGPRAAPLLTLAEFIANRRK